MYGASELEAPSSPYTSNTSNTYLYNSYTPPYTSYTHPYTSYTHPYTLCPLHRSA